MLCYAYNADIYCEKCGQSIRDALDMTGQQPADWQDETTFDSDDYPKGPSETTESDLPQHCAECGVFLENPLTAWGIKYVADAVGQGMPDHVKQWAEFYRDQLESSDDPIVIRARYAGAAEGPGKFEGESDWAVYLWDRVRDGCQDDTQYDPDDDTPIDIFEITDQDRAIFPELVNVVQVWIWEDDQGFVFTRTFDVGKDIPSWDKEEEVVDKYDVFVTNIGMVTSEPTNEIDAHSLFDCYVGQSKFMHGSRAYGQDVTLFCDNEIIKEHIGHLNVNENEVPTEPRDDDLVTNDYIYFRNATTRKVVAIVPAPEDDWYPTVKAYQEKEGYFGDIWFQNERGDYQLMIVDELPDGTYHHRPW